MGKKKSKDPDTSADKKDETVSAPSNIFKALFGDGQEQNGAVSSIFSDSNPFRRKPQEINSGLSFIEAASDPKNDIADTNDVFESKKGKTSKVKRPSTDSIEEVAKTFSVTRKSKKEKTQNPNFVFETNEGGSTKSLHLGVELNDEVEGGNAHDGEHTETKSRRKKRKRDELELELEYEARKYGVAANIDQVEEGESREKLVGQKRKKADNAADMMVSQEGFDDESKLLRTVFVGNLPMKVKKKVLLKEFSKYGEVESIRIRSVPLLDTKKPRKGAIMMKQINDAAESVHAYIVFKKEQSAVAALIHNMAALGGNHIRVDRACPPRKKLKGETTPLYDNKRTVFIGNLPFDVKDEDIYQLFSGNSGMETNIEAIRVIRDPSTSLGKGIAYVLFKTREAANTVIKKRNLKLRDRELRLSHARQNSTPSKRENPSLSETAGSPAKKLAMDSRTLESSGKSTPSYQGLRATKSGVQKKDYPKTSGPVKRTSNTRKEEKLRERYEKRPAVAERKAKAKVFKNGNTSKQAGGKRKMDSRTPETSQQKKKAKKFK
ncbi:RNA recognition motif-containing family protein [Tripterygium wilfordii]|uniref:RNA recognition motif-containing family protein n=1 Tax=Tripterygium wilfordii TaxID=458696 RepID=A0A7J7CM92_TRIWF|nr:nucleolar protein 12-like [Tripterygium wilfordii]KAF5735056.1 RNA recognition motif-containing family protein [Tripterygium wilfordii]